MKYKNKLTKAADWIVVLQWEEKKNSDLQEVNSSSQLLKHFVDKRVC